MPIERDGVLYFNKSTLSVLGIDVPPVAAGAVERPVLAVATPTASPMVAASATAPSPKLDEKAKGAIDVNRDWWQALNKCTNAQRADYDSVSCKARRDRSSGRSPE